IGANKLTLGGTNSYTGQTTVLGGTLDASAGGALTSGGGAIVVDTGGTLNVGAQSGTFSSITLTNGTISGTTGVLTSNNINLFTGTVSAILDGTGANVFKKGLGTLTLTGANTFTGDFRPQNLAANTDGGTIFVSLLANKGSASSVGLNS